VWGTAFWREFCVIIPEIRFIHRASAWVMKSSLPFGGTRFPDWLVRRWLVAACMLVCAALALNSCASSVRFSSAGGIDYRLLGSTSGGGTSASARTPTTAANKSQPQPQQYTVLQPSSGTLRTDSPLVTAKPDASSLEPTDLTFYGTASYYGDEFHGRKTASGEVFNQNAFTAAHRTLPFGTIVKVTYPETEKSVIVRINDRGPFKADRVIDLSRSAASELGLVRAGTGAVEVVVMQEREHSMQ